jgi:hypothetical protein
VWLRGSLIDFGERAAFLSGRRCYIDNERTAVIEQLKATQVSKLLALLESSEADKFVAHLYQARKQYRLVCESPNKGNKAIEREVSELPSRPEPGRLRRPARSLDANYRRCECAIHNTA